MNATIAAPATERKSPSVFTNVLAFIRNAIKQYGAPYLNGPLPPL